MAVLDYRTICELNRPVTIKHLDGMFFSQDVQANRIVVSVVRGGRNEDISGTVSANIIRADGATVVQTGEISGNVASVTMPSSAYAVPGAIAVFVKHTQNGVTSTLAAVTGYVYKSTTDTIVDPGTVVPNINELLAMIEDCEDATAACIAATAAAPTIDDTAGEGDTNKVWSASKTYELEDELDHIVRETTETDVDLDVVDEDGNVILRLEDGHIKTKEFDSSELPDLLDEKQDVLTFDTEPTEDSENPITSGGVYEALQGIEPPPVEQDVVVKGEEDDDDRDLDIVDQNGNAIARFTDGGFVVKQFDGRKYTKYSVAGVFNRQNLTITLNKAFKKGERVVLHVERGEKPWDTGIPMKYYEGNKLIADFEGDSAYYEHVITANCDSLSVFYASSAFSRSGVNLEFEVYLMGEVPIEPTVLTIKQDGTGNFTNLHDCLAYIGTSANDVLNPFRIEIYPGTYDVFDDYTDEEIDNINDDDNPDSPSVQEGFVGPKLLNGMSLVGIGEPSQIIINGYLDTEKWDKKHRDQISTLNMQGTSSMENLTVVATNLRYCVHDDFQFTGGKPLKRLVKHCVFRGYNVAYKPQTTYGAGCARSGGFYEFIDCDFGENAGLHQSAIQLARPHVRLVNCKGVEFRASDSSLTMPGNSVYEFINCDFFVIYCAAGTTGTTRAQIRGIGGSSPMYDVPLDMLYDGQDVKSYPYDIAVGTLVEWYADTVHGPKFRQATSLENVRGVAVYNDGVNTFIQTSGYIKTDRLGLTTFALHDYVGISNGSAVIVQNKSDSFGKIVHISSDGDGFVKLNWGE